MVDLDTAKNDDPIKNEDTTFKISNTQGQLTPQSEVGSGGN